YEVIWFLCAAFCSCDYREFRPYVNQHPYATLIADLVDHTGFVVGKHIGVQRLAVSASLSRRVHRSAGKFVSRKNRVLDQQKFGQGKQTWTNRVAPVKRRVFAQS